MTRGWVIGEAFKLSWQEIHRRGLCLPANSLTAPQLPPTQAWISAEWAWHADRAETKPTDAAGRGTTERPETVSQSNSSLKMQHDLGFISCHQFVRRNSSTSPSFPSWEEARSQPFGNFYCFHWSLWLKWDRPFVYEGVSGVFLGLDIYLLTTADVSVE